jgi:endonuclease/exonuclease/phosphatase family metal-dependent hydrolase
MPEPKNMDTYGLNTHRITSVKERGNGKHEIRVMTYNIHSCIDLNRIVNLELIAGIIQDLNADIVALQEVDTQKPRNANQNQAGILADKLRMEYVFFPVEKIGRHAFGLAVLSRFSFNICHDNYLPNLYPWLNPRKRGAIRASIQTPSGQIHIINAHLSLFKLERRKQLKTLLGKDWLLAIPEDEPIIFCGDLNAGPLSKTYRTLSRYFIDVQKHLNGPRAHIPQPTFPSKSPLFRIDHIFVSRHFQILNVEVRKTLDTQTASDHLPLIADLVSFLSF